MFINNKKLIINKKQYFNINDKDLMKIKFLYNKKIITGILFHFENEYYIHTKNEIIKWDNSIIIKKIINKFNLREGGQYKFSYKGKRIIGILDYVDDIYLTTNSNKILLYNFYNYNITYLIDIVDVIGEDYSIFDSEAI